MEHNLKFQNMPCVSSGLSHKLIKCFIDYDQMQKEEAFKAWTITDMQSLSFYIGICQNFFEYLALIYRKVFVKDSVFIMSFCALVR